MKYLLSITILALLASCSPKGDRLTSPPEAPHTIAPMEVHFVEQPEQINSLQEVTALFPDKLLYIDIWASWCGPCRMEFAYKKELHEFVDDKDIALVYISIDKANKKDNWERMVNRFDLGGHHIIANEKLKQDLVNQFYSHSKGGRKVISIPNFVIIDQQGIVKKKDAYRPSDEKKLYKQLGKYL